ncbi:MAG: hypothetical protein M3485_10205 [Pseudomonadota bacterium]|nr:hypothetical protein [Pseudomonadota bacterium]
MHYAPQDLKHFLLNDVPAGSVGVVVGRANDIGIILRLADDGPASRILMLEGTLPFRVTNWGVAHASLRVVCQPHELRIRLGVPADGGNFELPGVLTVHVGGAFIAAKRGEHGHDPIKIDLSSWTDASPGLAHGSFESYSDWEIGRVDERGHFVSLFQRKPPDNL